MTNISKSTYKDDNGNSSIGLERPKRNDLPLWSSTFPETEIGKLLGGIVVSFAIKQEPRLGWARKRACSETKLLEHPCEMVAAHQWGVCWLITCLKRSNLFRQEMPANFDTSIALEMGLIHDLAETITGDITPVDGISADEKHRLESEAMKQIMGRYPAETAKELYKIYMRYEDRQCFESKFVKDCDRLDFMITAFVLERQGFTGFAEFYTNSNRDFHTQLAKDLANQLIETRNKLFARSLPTI